MSASENKQQEFDFSPSEKVEFLASSNRRYQEEIALLKGVVGRLEEKVAMLEFQLYGTKNERQTQEIIELDAESNAPRPQEPPPTHSPTEKTQAPTGVKKHIRKLRAQITKEVTHIIIPDEVKENPNAFIRLPESSDKISRRLEYVPPHTELHIFCRPSFVKKEAVGQKTKESAPINAPAPPSIMQGSNIGASILAYVMHSRFALHLPFYRTIKELERLGLYGVDEALLCNWHRCVAEALEPIWRALHEVMMSSPVLHVDETPFRCLKSTKKKGYMWALSCAETGASLYYWQDSRSANVLDYLLREEMQPTGAAYHGTIITDGYEAYKSWLTRVSENENAPRWQNCWAHVRRKFVECMVCGNDPEWSTKIVELIQPLYKTERKLRETKAPPEQVQIERIQNSLPRVERFFSELHNKAKDSNNPPRNKLKDAIDYALKRKESLYNWLANPAAPIDNNQVERAIRPLTIGRKNSLFIGAPEAGQRSAILYTMVQECKRVKIDPLEWLMEVLRRLPEYRSSQYAYFDLLPGMLPLHSQKSDKAEVKL